MSRGPAVILSVAVVAATMACAGTAQPPSPTPTGFIRGTEPSPAQPPVGSPGVSPSPGSRVDGVWVGTITGHYENEVDGGKGHLVQDVEVDAYLTESSIPIVVDGVAVGVKVTLDQLGSVVTASMSHINRVDGSTCRGDGMVTLPSAQGGSAGWILHKWGDADVTSVVGFDAPSGPAWYSLDLGRDAVGQLVEIPSHCTAAGGYDDTFEPFIPPIGRWPMIAESDSWDVEMRTLSPDGLAMTGTYQRHWVVGDDVHDLTAEWNLTWAAEAP